MEWIIAFFVVVGVIVWLLDVMNGGSRKRLVNRLMKKHGIAYRE